MCHNDFMKHLDENLDCPLHAISRYYLRFMVKNVDMWYKKGKDNNLNDVLYVVDDAYVEPREGVESKKDVIENPVTTVNVNPHSNIECETKTSITDTPQPSITGRIDVSNDAYNERFVKICANMAAD